MTGVVLVSGWFKIIFVCVECVLWSVVRVGVTGVFGFLSCWWTLWSFVG